MRHRLTEVRADVLDSLYESETGLTTREVSRETGRHTSRARATLNDLTVLGWARRTTETREGETLRMRYRWHVTEEGIRIVDAGRQVFPEWFLSAAAA